MRSEVHISALSNVGPTVKAERIKITLGKYNDEFSFNLYSNSFRQLAEFLPVWEFWAD
jgi:hypothetical protein